MRIAIIVALAAALAGCAGSGSSSGEVGSAQGVAGNERGGKIPYQDGGMSTAMNAAQAHCKNFGKKAQITKMNPSSEGGELAFECN
jgi:hypothetical protein